MGVTKGKWGTLLNTLLDFKADYDRNAPLDEVLPRVVAAAPQRYAGNGPQGSRRRDVGAPAQEPAGALAGAGLRHAAHAEMTPRRAFQRLMAGDAEKVPLDKMADRVVAVGVIPYPPGIPIVMPGENVGAADGPGSPTCARCRSTATGSPASPRKSRAPRSTTAPTTSTA